ncbi:MAG: hypothetical protein JNK22_15965 [Rhodocyclaceae bacterium]|nr:hypothetical protein [Rhodocyclaceae bacterium]
MRIASLVSACAVAMGIGGCATVQETPYPVQPVKLVVPYPVGNAGDLMGRALAEKLGQMWGQPVTVENRPGPTTVVGTDAAAKAKADGYTLLVHSISFATDGALYTSLPYDPEKDFVPLAGFARQPFALVTGPQSGVKTVGDLVARGRASAIKYGSLGPRTQITFVTEQFKKQAGFPATNVPYKSLMEANGATMKGDVTFWFPPVAGVAGPIREGKLVPLAVTAAKRSTLLPQVPTMAEAGVANTESYAWFGLWAPAGVPKGLAERLSSDVAKVLQAPDVLEKLAKMGAEPMPMSMGEFGRFVKAEMEASRRLTGDLGIKPEAYVAPAKP